MPEQGDFVLQIGAEYQLSGALAHLPSGSRELVLNDGKNKPYLQKGRRVYLWESGGRGLVGRGAVMNERSRRSMPVWQQQFFTPPNLHDPDQPKAVISVDVILDPPLSSGQLRNDSVVAQAKFFKNPKDAQGTVF
jgi:hypothetical protein